MTVKSGQVWAGVFPTVDATGALSAGTPAGVLYVDGVADASVVTITGANPYKFSVTLPALTAGQRVQMYITATIAGIATAGVVASEQADTALVSDIDISGVPDAVLDEVVVGTYTMRQILKLLAAKMHGKASGGGTTTIKYTGLDATPDVIVETVDTNGNRSNVALTV